MTDGWRRAGSDAFYYVVGDQVRGILHWYEACPAEGADSGEPTVLDPGWAVTHVEDAQRFHAFAVERDNEEEAQHWATGVIDTLDGRLPPKGD
jgi:hypothetical protein